MARLFPCTHFVLLLLLQLTSASAGALERIDGAHRLTCDQGLTDCSVKDVAFPGMKGPVKVSRLELSVFLCCTNGQYCKPCLRVTVYFTIKDKHEDQEVSGDYSDEDDSSNQKELREESLLGMPRGTTASVTVCYSYPNILNRCKEVTFTLIHSALGDQHPPELWLSILLEPEPVQYGSPVIVHALYTSVTTTIPSLEDVCSPDLDGVVKECDAPKLRAVIDKKRGVAVLQLDSSNKTPTSEMGMCQMFGTGEPCRYQKWSQREMSIPLRSIAPCLCFQVWWKGHNLRREICPFMNNKELFRRMWDNNVSLSVEEAQTKVGNGTVLSWNVTAPCRLEGELWLCRRGSAGGHCEELKGSRQRMHKHTHAGWTPTLHGHWKRGEFINVNPHPALCVQMKVQGMDTKLDPVCPFATPRNRWLLTLLIGLLLICLAILGAYVIHGALKGYVWRWLKDEDIKGAVGGGHIVLLYPPDNDQAVLGLVCRLGLSLSSLGFSVSLDLWSQAELSVLGPVPWLHSRLDRLQRQGGKVVLVLTQAAWERAEEWGSRGSRGWERGTLWGRECDEDGESGVGCRSPYSDVFSASLSCILADYLQGRAGERFTLVQFECLPPGGCRPLPELFRGLPLFSLPSQSLGFLTELALGRGRGAASGRRRRAGGLRAASRALAGGLRGFVGGSAMLRLAGLPQDCVGAGVEDPWESVPLQPCLTTLPSSPDTCPRPAGWTGSKRAGEAEEEPGACSAGY
uniref:SEFIR domain-containing protein n=1 Tax=Oncorhynchus mykiss TaxID=8022 RepID=A0A8C7SRR9_ONCMY